MTKTNVDYSLYLVTDPRKDIVNIVRSALKGGVTVVQLREKLADTADLISTARALHEATQAYNVPLIINDRVDVALAVGCEGVHIGQDDLGRLNILISSTPRRTFLLGIWHPLAETSQISKLLDVYWVTLP